MGKRLTSTIRGGGLSPRGGMGNSDKEGPRARLGHHAKAKTHGPWSGHPESVGLDPEPRLSTLRAWTRPGTTRRSPCPLEKHEPRPLKCGRPSRGGYETRWQQGNKAVQECLTTKRVAIYQSKELGRECTPLELYFHVHTKKHDGQTIIDARSERVNSMRGGHPGASSSHPPPPPPPPRPHTPPRPSHQETLTPPTAVPTPALDANDVYRPRMYEPEDEEKTNLPLQQEWIDALSDTHPLPRPDRDN
ncbi:hypothetical protein Sjap_004829 [Stephania japonica]|uniref:Uncharacterized protein n=1 Tax=Stephania japonica TaxID=461633 RepID=A0AAP0PL93_9MAGN